MKVYDSFLFFNEIDLLKLRMEILKDVVDHFVIVESTTTFSSKDKKLFYDGSKELFKEFSDKIIHVVIDNTPATFSTLNYISNPSTSSDILENKILKHIEESTGWDRNNPNHNQWGVETYQRESIARGLIDCRDDDIIIISDVDEVPNPVEVNNIKDSFHGVYAFRQDMYFYYLNMLKERNWSGPKACSFEKLKTISLNSLRRDEHTTTTISQGGWHFSFMGGEKKIIEKIEAYAHQEFNNDHIKCNIKNNIDNNNDLFFRGQLTQVPIDETYPKYLLENLDKYSEMIKK